VNLAWAASWPVFFLLPLAISWLLTNAVLRLAPRFGLVDDPEARKVHTQRTPRGGGLAIYLAMAVAAFLLPQGHLDALRILALGLVIVVLGLIDDLRPLPWQLRLAVQTAVAIAGVVTLATHSAWYGQLGGVIWIVALTNAFNMLDNMDALSAGVAWIAAGLLAALAILRQSQDLDWQAARLYLMFMGALSGFLWFNRPPARIFMGDAGSTFLGFFLGLASLRDCLDDMLAPERLAAPVAILAIAWYDLITVVALRLWQGRSPFHADKQHLSHRLVQLGLRPPRAVSVIYLLGLASGINGLLIDQVSPSSAGFVAGQLACWWLVVVAIEYVGHYRWPHENPLSRL
jgi:UDP-GlcNAc:undecaprenyl-phosphate GlcNAc-1-phosphate transferase